MKKKTDSIVEFANKVAKNPAWALRLAQKAGIVDKLGNLTKPYKTNKPSGK